MARIKDYQLDRELELQDKVLGTDVTNNGTMNFSLEQLGEFLASSGLAEPSNLDFQFTYAGNTAPSSFQPGEIYFNSEQPASLTEVFISSTDLKGIDTGPLVRVLAGTVIELNDTKTSEGSDYGFYNVEAVDTTTFLDGYMLRVELYPNQASTMSVPQTDNVNLSLVGLAGGAGSIGYTPTFQPQTAAQIAAGEAVIEYNIDSDAPANFTLQIPDGPAGASVTNIVTSRNAAGDATVVQLQTGDPGSYTNLGNSFEVQDGDPGANGASVQGTFNSSTGVLNLTQTTSQGVTTPLVDNVDIVGEQGPQGIYTLSAYQTASATPSQPAPTQFTIAGDLGSTNGLPTGWSADPSTPTGGDSLYQVNAEVNPVTAVSGIVTLTWSVAFVAGAQGLPGDAAGFGTPTATGLAAGAQPTVTATGPDAAKIFAFGIPAGQPGAAAGFGTPTATAIGATDEPTVTATGPDTAKEFAFGIPAGTPGTSGMSVATYYSTAATGGTISTTYTDQDFIRFVTFTAGATPAAPSGSDVFTKFVGDDGTVVATHTPVDGDPEITGITIGGVNYRIAGSGGSGVIIQGTSASVSPDTVSTEFITEDELTFTFTLDLLAGTLENPMLVVGSNAAVALLAPTINGTAHEYTHTATYPVTPGDNDFVLEFTADDGVSRTETVTYRLNTPSTGTRIIDLSDNGFTFNPTGNDWELGDAGTFTGTAQLSGGAGWTPSAIQLQFDGSNVTNPHTYTVDSTTTANGVWSFQTSYTGSPFPTQGPFTTTRTVRGIRSIRYGFSKTVPNEAFLSNLTNFGTGSTPHTLKFEDTQPVNEQQTFTFTDLTGYFVYIAYDSTNSTNLNSAFNVESGFDEGGASGGFMLTTDGAWKIYHSVAQKVGVTHLTYRFS